MIWQKKYDFGQEAEMEKSIEEQKEYLENSGFEIDETKVREIKGKDQYVVTIVYSNNSFSSYIE